MPTEFLGEAEEGKPTLGDDGLAGAGSGLLRALAAAGKMGRATRLAVKGGQSGRAGAGAGSQGPNWGKRPTDDNRNRW